MINPINFCKEIGTDIKKAWKNESGDAQARMELIGSIALRIIGALVAVLAIALLISSISSSPVTVLGGIGLIAATAMLLVVAHDLNKIGENLRVKAYAGNLAGSSASNAVAGFIQDHSKSNIYLHDTFIAGPLYNLIAGNSSH